jgi:3-phosphoshikimate 1-carboxyvinyltransferase
MKRVIEPLSRIGAQIFHEPGFRAPLVFRMPDGAGLLGGRTELRVASAQVKSALLLSGFYTLAPVTVKEPMLSRDHTERMLQAFGVKLVREEDGGITMPLKQKLKACRIDVPGDISSAAFVLAAAAILPGSVVTVKNVGLNPTRTGFLDVLAEMGADFEIKCENAAAPEPRGDITLRYRPLKATSVIFGDIVPRLVDEAPILAVVAATARGTTVMRDLGELRVKESDRIALMVSNLRSFGVVVKELPDGLEITGRAGRFRSPRELEVAGDHRIAMALAIAALNAEGGAEFDDQGCIAVSFPGFAEVFRSLGAALEEDGSC